MRLPVEYVGSPIEITAPSLMLLARHYYCVMRHVRPAPPLPGFAPCHDEQGISLVLSKANGCAICVPCTKSLALSYSAGGSTDRTELSPTDTGCVSRHFYLSHLGPMQGRCCRNTFNF